jgi:hypothetical protein
VVEYNKMKVEDVKKLLIDEGYYKENEIDNLDIKGKTQWVDLHMKLSNENNIRHTNQDNMPTITFETLDIKDDSPITITPHKEEKKPPKYYDYEWQDYIMSLFHKEELIDGKYPSVNGLRRIVELILGNIIHSGPIETKTTLDPHNVGKAVVTYEITIEWKLDVGSYIDIVNDREHLQIKTFRALGSSWIGNTDDTYAVFPEAIAETRAEGRALRRALRLGVVCSDELTKKNTAEIVKQSTQRPTDGNWNETDLITDNQINSIKILCDRLGVNMFKFINSGAKTYNNINEISRKTAANMIKKLNEYQNNNSIEIPNNILKG